MIVLLRDVTRQPSTVSVERPVSIRRSPMAAIGRVRRDSLVRNSLFIISTTIVNSFFGYIFWLLGARLFPAHVVGLNASLVAVSTIIVLLASLGVGGTLMQSLPEAGGSPLWSLTFWAGMGTGLGIGVALVGAALFMLPLIADEFAVLRSPEYATVLAVGTLATTAGAVLDYAYLAERAAGNMLGRNSVVAVGKVLLTVLLTLMAGAHALTMLGAWAAAALVGLVLGIGLLRLRVAVLRPPGLLAIAHRIRSLRARLTGQQFIGIGGALLPYFLSVLVTVRISTTDNAYFYTTWMMAGIFLIVAPAVSLSLFAEGVHSPDTLHQKARSALAIIGAILVPGAIAVFASGGILLSAFGAAYESHAVGLLRLLLLASLPDAITNVYVAMLRVQGRLAVAAGLNLGMAVGTVGLAWALLPALGTSAVGWAFLVAQLFGCLFVVLDRHRRAAATAGIA
jgi:O-antigen/teichoic acid export membrane protein